MSFDICAIRAYNIDFLVGYGRGHKLKPFYLHVLIGICYF